MIKNKYYSLPATYAFLLGLSLLTACGEQTDTHKTTSVDSTTRRTDTTGRTAGNTAVDPGLTLPVLDALFYEESFEQELKTKLQLTDEQVQKLKRAASASVSDLSEEASGDYLGSARAAASRSEEQIRGILGEEKTVQLHQFVSQRYAGGDIAGLLPDKPNTVPTDTRVVVNAPAYRMDVFQDGKLVKTYKVGIGYPEFPLPAGMRRAETIIFNPTWTPPDEPWVKGKVRAGEKVEAGSKLNPLGPIKIPIGLPNLIHGGKQPAKLGTFASHGCVGLTNDGIKDFALTLAGLSGAGLTQEEIGEYGKNKTETKPYKLEHPVPVELRYETIIGEPGGLRVFRDVYERGTNTFENARRVLEVYGLTYEQLSPQEQSALMAALTEMNRDPQGNAVVADIGGPPAAAADSTGTADTGKKKEASLDERAKNGKETKTVKGRKEVLVPIAAMQGKGYPVPVNLYGGSAATAGSTSAASERPVPAAPTGRPGRVPAHP